MRRRKCVRGAGSPRAGARPAPGCATSGGAMKIKITQVVAHARRAQLTDPFSYSQGFYAHRDAVLVEVRTDSGLTGWGQCSGSVDVVPRAVERHYAPRLIGQDPRDWQRLWHLMGGLTGGHYG